MTTTVTLLSSASSDQTLSMNSARVEQSLSTSRFVGSLRDMDSKVENNAIRPDSESCTTEEILSKNKNISQEANNSTPFKNGDSVYKVLGPPQDASEIANLNGPFLYSPEEKKVPYSPYTTTTTTYYHLPPQEETFPFDLDSRSPSLASLKISTSQCSNNSHTSLLNSVPKRLGEKINTSTQEVTNVDGTNHSCTEIKILKPAEDHNDEERKGSPSGIGAAITTFHEIPGMISSPQNNDGAHSSIDTNTSSHVHSSIQSQLSKSGSPKHRRLQTPPSSLLCNEASALKILENHNPTNTIPHSTSSNNSKELSIQEHENSHQQEQREKKKRLIRPFVYSAIGSLEQVNQHSFGSFNHKLIAASKLKKKNATGKTHDGIRHEGKKKKQDREKKKEASVVLEPIKDKKIEERTKQGNSEEMKKSNTSNLDYGNSNSVPDLTSLGAHTEQSELRQKVHNVLDETTKTQREGNKISSKRNKRKNQKKKNVTIDAKKEKKITQVELFRPSCDAYTPRIMGRRELKYKPAEERASLEKMSTTMGTIHRPNFRDALRRVAIIIQQHIVKIERRFELGVPGLDNAGLFTPAMRDAFAEENFVTPRYKCSMVKLPMARPGVLYGMRKIRTEYPIPSTNDIYEFAHQLFNSVQLSSECSIICLIYVERLMEVAKVPVMANTWKPIVMCGLLLASKVWQDWSSWNIEFATVYPQFSLDSINKLEVQYLKMVKWDLYISSSLYAKYYFALRSILEKQDFRRRYNSLVGGVDSRAALEAVKVSKRSEMAKEEALSHLSTSM